MAFDKTPQQSTYQTKDIKLVFEWESRNTGGTHDNTAINCYYELIKNKEVGDQRVYVTSRDGTVTYPYVIPSTNIRGIYYWEDQNKLYVAYDQSIAVITASTGALVTTLTPGFAAGTGEVGFTEFNYSTNTYKLVVSDGTVLGTIDSSNVVVLCVDADLPAPHVPNPVYLDGYIFLVKVGTADIYNSDQDDPLNWVSGEFISAEMLPDTLVKLMKLNNYLVAFGTGSVEYFYDGANATGSPLQRNDTPVKLLGYLGGIAQWGNKIFFVGNSSTSNPELFMLEDFKIEMLGTPPLRRYLEPYSSFTGSVISFQGHDFYVLNVGSLTYMVDLESRIWTQLKYKQQTDFPIKFAVSIPISGYGNTSLFVLTGVATMSTFRSNVFLDDGVDFSPTIITDNEMFDTYRIKFGGRLSIIADRPTTSAYVTVSWTDDDYQTYSTGRTILLNQAYPQLNSLGSFRRRAHKLVHTGNSRFRCQKLEIDINMGAR